MARRRRCNLFMPRRMEAPAREVVTILLPGARLPPMAQIRSLAEQGCPPEYDVVAKQVAGMGAFLGVLVLVAIFFMTVKPFA
jgi:hypothetical protein